MNKLINSSIYLVYTSLALLSIAISYKVSIILCLMVLPLEGIRMLAIYKRTYMAIVVISLLNLFLISYTAYKGELLDIINNNITQEDNQFINTYTKSNQLRATTAEKMLKQRQKLKHMPIDYRLIILVYSILELALILFVYELDRKNKQELKK